MKSRLSLKNSVRAGLNLFIILYLVSGCSSSTAPTYLKEDITEAIQDICKNEYKIDVRTKLVGQTLWIYLPVEDIFVKADKPEKYSEKFNIETNQNEFQEDLLKIQYVIYPILSEKEKYQEYKYNKTVLEKINNVWKVLRRVIFSMERLKTGEPKFFYLIIADIKNGFELQEITYSLDLKKVSYEFISWGEYQHRAIQETQIAPEIIGDKEGTHINYKEITLKDFILKQIDHRIKLKFQKPEVEVDKNFDIDKEILKIVVYTIKTYDFKDFNAVELNNLFTRDRTFLNKAAVWASSIE
jgi:hypothetical protein